MEPSPKPNNQNSPKTNYFQKIMLAAVYDLAVATDLSMLDKVSQKLGNSVWLKREDMQPIKSFKVRGAYNKIKQLSAAQKIKGVVAASAGNHAQGVALSAVTLGIKATIVMPITTPEIKVNAVRGHGGEVILHGDCFDEANNYARQLAQTQRATFIPPFDDADIIVGQGTVAKELLQQNPTLERVFIPVGGGGLLAGMAVYIKTLLPQVQVIGVEFEESACLTAALEAGQPIALPYVGQFADGVAVKQIGEETFRLVQQYCDEVITVSSDEICAAIKDIYNDVRAVAEPAGALSLAGLSKYLKQHKLQYTQAAAILTGANMNFDNLGHVSERTELGGKTEAVLAVTIKEEKGSFRRFCEDIGDRMILEFNYRYWDDCNAPVFVGIRLSEGAEELERLHRLLNEKGYTFTDLSDDEFTKQHVRFMIGGKPQRILNEQVYHIEIPEHRGALGKFLNRLLDRWNISLFHYRNDGSSIGQVLVAFEVSGAQLPEFERFFKTLGYNCKEQSGNLGYQLFLQHWQA